MLRRAKCCILKIKIPPCTAADTNKRNGEKLMLNVTVCIGSSCHLKGSRQVVEQLQKLIAEHEVGEKVELGGTFCMGKCQKGVCVTVGEEFYSVTPETVVDFFNNDVLPKVK